MLIIKNLDYKKEEPKKNPRNKNQVVKKVILKRVKRKLNWSTIKAYILVTIMKNLPTPKLEHTFDIKICAKDFLVLKNKEKLLIDN